MKQMKILLADDQALLRSALRLWLEQQPHIQVVEEAAEASSLMAKIEAALPDILLLDWELPGLGITNGTRQLLHALRNGFPQLRVVAFSSHPEARMSALNAGVDAFVSKTAPPDLLLDAFNLVSGQSKIGD
ncbi:MAG: response regulator transcription factor [Caldilineaceae bacterium]